MTEFIKKNIKRIGDVSSNTYDHAKVAVNRHRQVHDYDKEEFRSYIEDLMKHEKVRQMAEYIQHSDIDCLHHCLRVSYYNFKVCKKLGLDAKSAARAGLLHDFFLYDWHYRKVKLDNTLHGFSHPYTALYNAQHYFDINDKERDIIEKHMFPLTPRFPKYKETFVIILTDKFISTGEVMDRFFKHKKSA